MKGEEMGLALRALIARGRFGDGTVRSGRLRDDHDCSGVAAGRSSFAHKVVAYPTPVSPGTIVIDPGSHFLCPVHGGGQAIRQTQLQRPGGLGHPAWAASVCRMPTLVAVPPPPPPPGLRLWFWPYGRR
jgi:hypothetical protein